jgi:nitrogen fixation NifU-like protein
MMSGVLEGLTVEEAMGVMGMFTRMLKGDAAAAANPDLGDLRALAGVSRFPVRVKCALLAWNCLQELVGPESARP